MADLVVELYGVRVGSLTGGWRTFDFVADLGAVEAFGIDSPILSVAIPLAAVPTRGHKDRRQNFFRELLPEGQMLTRMAREADLAAHDVVGLLRAYGRDVAGAVQIWDPDAPGEPRQPACEELGSSEVANLLKNVQTNPLGNKPGSGKTSLAGVQDKIVLARISDGWYRALDGYPSTHILKPEIREFPTMIYDEEYGSRLARAAGLAEFRTWIEEFQTVPALIIERYDRSPGIPHGRIHQEDFNQALGASGNEKYQRHGGKVSLRRIAKVLSAVADPGSLEGLLRMTVLSVAVGNLDMHAKNVSLVHRPDASMTLAPAYDFVPQAHQANDAEMALAVNDEDRHYAITRAHLVAEGEAWGLDNSEAVIDDTLAKVLDTAASETPHPNAHPHLVDDITRFASNLLSGRPVGDR